MDSLLAELYQKHPELRAQRGEFRPLAEAELASLLGNSETAVLEFVVDQGFGRGAFVFAVTRDQCAGRAAHRVRIP